jgi:hypothetical protein
MEDLGRSRTLYHLCKRMPGHIILAFRRAPSCLVDLAATEQGITRPSLHFCSPEPLPELDAVAVGVTDLRS